MSSTTSAIDCPAMPPVQIHVDRLSREAEFSKAMPKPPENPRRYTDPVSSITLQSSIMTPTPHRLRNRSPYARSHLRSRSSGSLALAPPMTRARSMPVGDTYTRSSLSPTYSRSSSPLGSPGRQRGILHPRVTDEPFPDFGAKLSPELSPLGTPLDSDEVAECDEVAELETTPKAIEATSTKGTTTQLPLLTNLAGSNTFPRRYRPASPLRQVSLPTFTFNNATSIPANRSNPTSLPTGSKFNEPFPSDDPSSLASVPSYFAAPPSLSYSSASSMPSTPTSARSRSPSISSLETIPDSPDAEEAALEAERIAKLKAAADASDAAENSEDGSSTYNWRRRGSFGAGAGSWNSRDREKRKRWSVCGAERRGDFDLETIWED